MKKLFLLTLTIVITIVSCTSKQPDLVCERINYVLTTKQKTAAKYWPDFEQKLLYNAMLYYAKNGTYSINAATSLKKKLQIKKSNCSPEGVTIGYSKKIDTTNFYMYVSYDDINEEALEYKIPLAMFSDVALTKKFIPDVKDTEEWMSMVIHEMFHQYQKGFTKFRTAQVERKKMFNRDTLNYFFKNLKWYKKSVQDENKLLLRILKDVKNDSVKTHLKSYLTKKSIRLKKIEEEYGIKLEDLENNLAKSEGTARYIEFCVKKELKHAGVNTMLEEIDSLYVKNRFKDYSLKKDGWMYNVWGSYYYALGFNLTRVLEKLAIDYQKTIFKDNISFDIYLKAYVKNE